MRTTALIQAAATRSARAKPHKGGRMNSMGAPDQERKARSRHARTEAGGKQIAVMLTPAAAAKLAAWVARGETIAGIVNRLLTRSKP